MTVALTPELIKDNSVVRCVRLSRGDVFTIVGYRNTKPGEYLKGTRCLCIRRIKRDKWWQFWKPRYKSSVFVYVGNE